MIDSYEMFTKEKTISYEQKIFIKTSLRQLGINPKNNGMMILQKAIIYAYTKDMVSINLEEIYRNIAKNCDLSNRGVESIIRYSFYNINTKKLHSSYPQIFGIEFCSDFFSIKTLICDFLDVLENMESIK